MYADARKAFALIEQDQRSRLLLVLAGMVATAILQTAGVVSVMPFLALVADPGIVERNQVMASVYDFLGRVVQKQF